MYWTLFKYAEKGKNRPHEGCCRILKKKNVPHFHFQPAKHTKKTRTMNFNKYIVCSRKILPGQFKQNVKMHHSWNRNEEQKQKLCSMKITLFAVCCLLLLSFFLFNMQLKCPQKHMHNALENRLFSIITGEGERKTVCLFVLLFFIFIWKIVVCY